jgi:hypothetical protein
MKIKPDHYEILKSAVTGALSKAPWLEVEYQAAGYGPKLLRWDTFRTRAGMYIGDSVGMPCPDDVDPAMFLPLYDYMDDTHIDTALRQAFKEAGYEYGAAKDAAEANPLVITNGSQFTQSGNMIANMVHRDPESGVESKATCCVTPNGQVIAAKLFDGARKQPEGLAVIDIDGEEHEVRVEENVEMRLVDPQAFVVQHSSYTVTTYDLVINDNDIADGHGAEHEGGRWENAPFTFEDIEGEARNLGLSEFGPAALYSTDPSGTREFYEQGVNRYHHLQIDTINGAPAQPEMVAALGKALGLTPSPELAQQSKPAQRMSM